MIRAQVQLTEDQMERLRERARRERVSIASLIRSAVDRMLSSSTEPSERERRRQTLDVIGAFSSGRGDVSRHHDAHLAEVYATPGRSSRRRTRS